MREQERATESEETERSSWGLATLTASEGEGQPGLLRVGFLSLLFLRVDGLGNRWFSVSEVGQPVNAVPTFPTTMLGRNPFWRVRTGHSQKYGHVAAGLSTGYILLTRQSTHCQHP